MDGSLTSPRSAPAPEDPTLDRAVGALLGLACGDAVGTTLEFRRPGTFEPIDDLVGGGPFHLSAGQWTDDTSMALCLAESLLDTGGMDLADQHRRYLLWREEGYLSSNGECFDIGTTVSRQLARFERTGVPVDPHPDEEAAANGSLMRLAPVAIRWHPDPAEAAERAAESSRTTHAATRPVDACRLLGAMTAALIAGRPAEEVLHPGFWDGDALHPAIQAVARGSWQGKEPPEIRGTGYCVDALEAAIWAVAGAPDYRTAVLRAANLGDDADTTAAIAGQLAGARWGLTGIPAEWRARLAAADRITSLAAGLHAAATTGTAPHPWPFEHVHHAWWVEHPWVLAGEYPASIDGARTPTKVALLIDAGIRTFVDLTTPDDPLDPYEHHVAEAAANRRLDLRRHHHPIPDFSVADDATYEAILSTIRAEQARGGVYVHCWGGIGRTGTVVGALLAATGAFATFAELEAHLALLRAGTGKAGRPCPEAPVQVEYLRRLLAS